MSSIVVNSLSNSRAGYICSSCASFSPNRRKLLCHIVDQRRWIAQRWLNKTAEAADQWARQAIEIKAGKRRSMLSILEQRGYINQIAGERDELDRLMIKKRIGAYVGIDPTAPSLHVGHLVPLMSLFWLFIHGCHAVTLLGGATAKVGDPIGRASPREEQHSSVRKANMASMHIQLKSLWMKVEKYVERYGYKWEWAWHRELANNNMWLNKLGTLELLQLVGSGTRIGTMLGKDTVRKRLESGDGMSLSEFLYPVLQSVDWWHMYHTKGIQVQIGGSDQFGNIVAGIDTIKYINKNHYNPEHREEKEHFLNTPMGFTVPLLTAGSGEKFGKSAGNGIWLDADMTSPFDLYQFFIRTADADVGRYLKLFTFIPIESVGRIMKTHESQPSNRIAQRKLAYEVLALVHGESVATEVEKQHALIFRAPALLQANSIDHNSPDKTDVSPRLNPHAPQITSVNAPSHHVILPRSLVYNQPIARVLHAAGLVSSRSEGHRLAEQRGAYIGSRPGDSGEMGDQLDFTPAHNWKPQDTNKYLIENDLLILRAGKWKIKIVKIVSDEEFEKLGLAAPGWKDGYKEEEPQPKDSAPKIVRMRI